MMIIRKNEICHHYKQLTIYRPSRFLAMKT